jgi:Leucine-rich repeat (LRR) protein
MQGNILSRDQQSGLCDPCFTENLQYLKLGDNNIHSIPSDALRRLHRLRHLDLRSNNISNITDDAFTGFGDTISFLNLQKNE